MNDIRKKIIIDLLVSPWSVFPTAGGISVLMLSWALNVWGTFSFFGVIAILVGIGVAITNFTFNLSNIALKAAQELRARELQKQDAILDQLDAKLVKDRDPRDQGYLRELRAMYRDFVSDMDGGKVVVNPEMVLRVDQIFKTCVSSLEEGYNLWEQSQKLPASSREKITLRRERILKEVEASVSLLGDTLVEIRTLGSPTGNNLSHLREDLAIQLEAARRTKERLASLDGESERDFSEYES